MITKLRLNLMDIDILENISKGRKKKDIVKIKKARLGKVKEDQLWIYIEFWIASCGNYEPSYTWFQSLQNQ